MANNLKRFIRFCYLLPVMFGLLYLTGCSEYIKDYEFKPKETPHLYWKDIEVVITDIDKRHWYASSHRYQIYLTVESDEYGLSQSFTLTGSEAKEKMEMGQGRYRKSRTFFLGDEFHG